MIKSAEIQRPYPLGQGGRRLFRSGKMVSIQWLRAKDGQFGINNHELMHALINIVEEFHRQGVRRDVFGSLFPRLEMSNNFFLFQ